MTAQRFSVITFDLDDTLWDVRPVLIEAERRMNAWLTTHCVRVHAFLENGQAQLIRNELITTEPGLSHHFSRLRTKVLHTAITRAGYPEPQAKTLADAAFEVFLHARHDLTLFDGVAAMLRKLGQHYRLGALSNGNADPRRLPIGALFNFHFSAETVGAPKPDPAMFHAALQHTGAAAHEVLHVGDNPEHDVLGADRAGVRCVWVNATGSAFPDLPVRPFAEVRTVLELPALLVELGAP